MVQWLKICLPMQGTQARHRFSPWSRIIPHSRAAKATHHNYQSPRVLEAVLHNKRSHYTEELAHRNQRVACTQRSQITFSLREGKDQSLGSGA